jgi:glycosyltransferase involved in cell wall biosynthesis
VKLTIVSHTPHYYNSNKEICGWGPTILEVNSLLRTFDTIDHIAPLHKGKNPNSSICYISSKIRFIPLKETSGKGILSKVNSILKIPSNLWQIHSHIGDSDLIQYRGPTGIGLYFIPYLAVRSKPKRWFKYAGNWIENNSPITFRIQRWMMNANLAKCYVTINGKWPNQKPHLLSFENPCLTNEEIISGGIFASQKKFEKDLIMCFVGSLEPFKGALRAVKALINSRNTRISKFIIIGDGTDKIEIEKLSINANIKIEVRGFLDRIAISEVYKSAHLIILPSESEGFPKVIAEASAYGCIPIVSDVSSIGQYINSNNGFLMKDSSIETISNNLTMLESSPNLSLLSRNVQSIAKLFTFEYYNDRIKTEILNNKSNDKK